MSIDIDFFIQFLKKLWQYRFVIGSLPIRIKLKAACKSLSSSSLYEYLAYQYGKYKLLECNGYKYAVVVFPINPVKLSLNIEKSSILEELDQNWHLEQIIKHYSFYWLMRSKIPDYDNRTFIMKKLKLDQQSIKIECAVSRFFKVISSAYSLEWEILEAIAKYGSLSPQELHKRLPLRQKLHNCIDDPIIDGGGRANGIGVSVLLAYDDEQNNTYVMLRRRGILSIATHHKLLHVLPSGNFQAIFGEYKEEYNIMHCVLWEYFEELFSAHEPIERRLAPKWFYEEQPVYELIKMIKSNLACLYLTGVAVDLLNLRPELLLLLYIRDKKWFSRHEKGTDGNMLFKYNTEWATEKELSVSQEALLNKPFKGNPENFFNTTNIKPEEITPPGAAALWIGLQCLSKYKSSGLKIST